MPPPHLNRLPRTPRIRGRGPRGSVPYRLRAVALLAVVAVGVAGCGNYGGGSRTGGGKGAITFTSCGQTFVLDHVPQRVVILNDGIADTLLALGVENRIVAKTRGESAPLPALKKHLAAVRNIGTRNPSTEALITTKPDLLITDQIEKVSGKENGPTIAELKRLNIATYVAGDCAPNVTSESAGLEPLFTDLRQLGEIFGVTARARAQTNRLRGRLDDVRRRTAHQPRVGVVEIARVGAQLHGTAGGISHDVINRAGGQNILGDLPGMFAPISFEQIIGRNPPFVIIDDFTASERGRTEAIAFMRQRFPSIEAVKRNRVLVIDAAKTGARGSTRPVDGVVEIARYLHPSAFGAG